MFFNLNVHNTILFGVPFLFILAFLTHYVYLMSGKNFIVGLLFPSNESVFEHMKLFTVSGFMYWLISYFFKKEEIERDLWFTSALISMIIIVLLIPMLHYFFTESTGKEIVLVDIGIAFIVVAIGQLIAVHFYEYGTGVSYRITITFMVLIIVLFAVLTVKPLKSPIFTEN